MSVYAREPRALSYDTVRMALVHAERLTAVLSGPPPGRALAELLELRRDIGRAVGIS